MKLYRVVATQLVYHECYVEAETENEAWEIVQGDDSGWLDWNEFTYGDWEILDVEYQTEAKFSSEETE